MGHKFLASVVMSFVFYGAFAQKNLTSQREYQELGTVNWQRNYDEALRLSEEQNKPVLLLFQEVPGCATCRNYGKNVLSHPLLVEGIENEFIPLAIFNNKGGDDRRILQKYNEPTWNNPVLRIVDAQGKDIIPRVASKYSPLSVLTAMTVALEKQGIEIPIYLQLLKDELSILEGSDHKIAYYKMFCF